MLLHLFLFQRNDTKFYPEDAGLCKIKYSLVAAMFVSDVLGGGVEF
jgi:hypothetical protein